MSDELFALTVRVSPTECDLWLLLKDANIERIRLNDPINFNMGQCEEPIRSLKTRRVVVCYANEADYKTVWKLLTAGNMPEAMRYLSRGWQFKPEAGDSDKTYPTVLMGGRFPKPKSPPSPQPSPPGEGETSAGYSV